MPSLLRDSHTMIRIKVRPRRLALPTRIVAHTAHGPRQDPKKSLPFYTDVLGMDLLDEHDAGDFKVRLLVSQTHCDAC